MKTFTFRSIIIFLLLTYALVGQLSAMGTRDESGIYKSELQRQFTELITDIYSDEIDAAAAKKSLKSLRDKYDISYTDEAGIMEAIIDRAVEKTLSREEAQFYFQLLNDGKLMDHRSGMHHIELIALLQQKLQADDFNDDIADQLMAILNNYYNFFGLEYDEQYSRLSSRIQALREGSISVAEMKSNLESIDKELTQNNYKLNSKMDAQQLSHESNELQSGGGSQDAPGSGTSVPAESQGGAVESGQKPQGSGAGEGSRK